MKKKRPARKSRTGSIKFLTPDELKRLFVAIKKSNSNHKHRDYALFLVAYRHGLRASEMALLRVSDIDFKRMKLNIPKRLKESLAGVHMLWPDEAKAIKAYLNRRVADSPILFLSRENAGIHRATLDVLMKQYGETAKLPEDKRHFHVLKHSIATHLLDAGEDIRFVQDWLGHAAIQNTTIYAQLTSTRRDEKARALSLKMPRY